MSLPFPESDLVAVGQKDVRDLELGRAAGLGLGFGIGRVDGRFLGLDS
jgi:hypothetical protein